MIADAQDGGGANNATFATPADGTSPRMQMFHWFPEIVTVNSPGADPVVAMFSVAAS